MWKGKGNFRKRLPFYFIYCHNFSNLIINKKK